MQGCSTAAVDSIDKLKDRFLRYEHFILGLVQQVLEKLFSEMAGLNFNASDSTLTFTFVTNFNFAWTSSFVYEHVEILRSQSFCSGPHQELGKHLKGKINQK